MERTKNERINDILTEVSIHTKRMNNHQRLEVLQGILKVLVALNENESLDKYLADMDIDEEFRGEFVKSSDDMLEQISAVLKSAS